MYGHSFSLNSLTNPDSARFRREQAGLQFCQRIWCVIDLTHFYTEFTKTQIFWKFRILAVISNFLSDVVYKNIYLLNFSVLSRFAVLEIGFEWCYRHNYILQTTLDINNWDFLIKWQFGHHKQPITSTTWLFTCER